MSNFVYIEDQEVSVKKTKMTADKIKSLIKNGEGLTTEFKRARDSIPQSMYQSICAFLNTNGGDILLGVEDNGDISGINPKCISTMKKHFADSMNNSHAINPPLSLELKECNVDGKIVLHVFIPKSSQPHRCAGKVFLRNHETDQDISNNNYELLKLYTRKSGVHSENKIYPYLKIEDLRIDLIEKAKDLACRKREDHPWVVMDTMGILDSMSFYQKDIITGQEGFTLSCLVLLGNDRVIHSALPAFKVDLIKRVENIERYDDRLTLRTNLIESYEQSMEFIRKHLPDPFYLEGSTRIDIRETIFREIIANMLIHKEYTFDEPTRFIIERDKIIVENSNNPRINGIISPDKLRSHPKNPNICKFFREIGRSEELGSGFRTIYKYCKEYSGADPVIKDGDIFEFELPILKGFFPLSQANEQASIQVTDPVSDPVSDPVTDPVIKILNFCHAPRSFSEIMKHCNFKNRTYFRNKFLNPLVKSGELTITIPEKPNSSKQKYVGKQEKK